MPDENHPVQGTEAASPIKESPAPSEENNQTIKTDATPDITAASADVSESSVDADARAEHMPSMDEYDVDPLGDLQRGTIYTGTVVSVDAETALVDIGYKYEGRINLNEFDTAPAVGDSVDAVVIRRDDENANLLLSVKQARIIRCWDTVLDAEHEHNGIISGTVIKKQNSVFIVDIGMDAVLPVSQIRFNNAEDIIGQEFSFKILRLNRRKKEVVLSRREYIDEIREQQKGEFFATASFGDTHEGIVRSIMNYGVFVDIGAVDGLLHNNDISWGHVRNPKDFFKVGDKIKVMILEIDKDKGRVSLGYKQLTTNPWNDIEMRYQVGNVVKGTISNLKQFGAFIELEEGIEGLIPISELTWSKNIRHPREVVDKDDVVEVKVLTIDKANHRISLGLKQVLPNPWDDVQGKYHIGQKIVGKVVKITRQGAFVQLDDVIDGFLSIDDVAWVKKYKNPEQYFKMNQHIEARIEDIDKENNRIRLSIKNLTANPYRLLRDRYRNGDTLRGKVINLTANSAFIRIDENIDGHVRISEISKNRIEKPSDVLKIGQEINCVVKDINVAAQRISLSIKDYENAVERKEIGKYMSDGSSSTYKMGELFKNFKPAASADSTDTEKSSPDTTADSAAVKAEQQHDRSDIPTASETAEVSEQPAAVSDDNNETDTAQTDDEIHDSALAETANNAADADSTEKTEIDTTENNSAEDEESNASNNNITES